MQPSAVNSIRPDPMAHWGYLPTVLRRESIYPIDEGVSSAAISRQYSSLQFLDHFPDSRRGRRLRTQLLYELIGRKWEVMDIPGCIVWLDSGQAPFCFGNQSTPWLDEATVLRKTALGTSSCNVYLAS